MGWVFALLLIGVLIFLFVESKTTRYIALAALAFAGVLALTLVYFSDQLFTSQEVATVDETARTVDEQRARQESSRTIIPIADVALIKRRLEPVKQTRITDTGETREISDLFHWRLSGEIINRNAQYMVRDVVLRIELFSCPSFFDTPQARVSASELTANCAPIGSRSHGVYGLDVTAGGQQPIDEAIEFDNQPEPRNWRYLVSIEQAVAKFE